MTQVAEDTKARLLTAAGELFAEHGLEGATARQICERAGVNIAAINYHFKSKEHLYLEAVKAAVPIFRAGETHLAEDLERLKTSGNRQEAVALFEEYVRLLARHMVAPITPQWKVKLFMREMLAPHPGCRDFFRRHIQNNFRILMGILDLLMPRETPEERKIQTALSVVAQCLYYRLARELIHFLIPSELRSEFTEDKIARHVTEFTLSAIGIREPFVRQWESRDG